MSDMMSPRFFSGTLIVASTTGSRSTGPASSATFADGERTRDLECHVVGVDLVELAIDERDP